MSGLLPININLAKSKILDESATLDVAIGWRFWRLTKECYLQSAVRDTVWPRYKPMGVDDPNWCEPRYDLSVMNPGGTQELPT